MVTSINRNLLPDRDTYLFDEFGNAYAVVGVDTKPDPNYAFSEKIPVGVRVNHWFEFPPPKNDAKVFNFVLANNHLIPHFGGVEFPIPVFVINLTEF